jgi:hypothetical protein
MADKLVFILNFAPWPEAVAQLIDEQITKLAQITIKERLPQGLNSLLDARQIGSFGE